MVYLSDLSKEIVSQRQSYDIWSLFSKFYDCILRVCKICSPFVGDIGGTLGLFLGASIMTMFEIVDLLIREGFQLFARKYEIKICLSQTKCKVKSIPKNS